MIKIRTVLGAAVMAALPLMPLNAKDVYGFLTGGDGATMSTLGIYKFDTSGGGDLEQQKQLGYQFWGGAYACDGLYYMFLSDDQNGYIPEGLCTYDLTGGETAIPKARQTYACSDMTFDYSTSTMYGIVTVESGTKVSPVLAKIDLSTGARTDIATLSEDIRSLACDYYGDMYAMSSASVLYRMDQATGRLTEVGSTGVSMSADEATSMEFDRATGELYWTALNADNNAAFIAKLNVSTGAVLSTQQVTSNSLIVGLHIPFVIAESDAPAKPTGLSANVADGAVALSWKNPDKTYGGQALFSGLTKIEIVRNGEVVHEITNPVAGEELSWTDQSVSETKGAVRYVVYAYNETGRGEGASLSVVLGDDVPSPVADLVAERNGDGALLTWTAPSVGANGGSLSSGLTYKVTRMPDEKVFENISETTLSDNTVQTTSYYYYNVVALNAAGESEAVASDVIAVGEAIVPPYTADLNSDLGAGQWNIIDENNDGTTWTYSASNGNYQYFTSFSNAANDHLLSVPFSLKKGNYVAAYNIKATSLFGSSEHFRLSLVDGEDEETELEDLPDYSNTDEEERSVSFSVDNDGEYSFKMSALSAANQWTIVISGFSVEAIVNTDVAILSVESDGDLKIGKVADFNVVLENKGLSAAAGVTVKMEDNEGNFLASGLVKNELGAGESTTVALQWTPTTTDVTSVVFTVELEGDELPDNNSYVLPITVLQEDEKFIELGGKDSTPTLLPFAFEGSSYSYAEAIYRSDEIGEAAGWIREMRYSYNNQEKQPVEDRHIKVYLSNTANSSIMKEWIPSADMTLVYDGVVNFDKGEGTLNLVLDEPFYYNGSNLCVQTQKIEDSSVVEGITFSAQKFDEARTALYNGNAEEVDTDVVEFSTMLNYLKIRIGESDGGVEAEIADMPESIRRDGSLLVVDGTVDVKSITLVDLAGKTVAKVLGSDRIDVSGLAHGVYIVVAATADGQFVKKFIVD